VLPFQRSCPPGAALICAAVVLLLLMAPGLGAQQAVPSAVTPATGSDFSLELENPHLGYTSVGEGGVRYFVTQIRVRNASDKPVTVPMSQFELTIDGVVCAPDLEFPRLSGYDFRVGGKTYRFRDLERTTSLEVAPRDSSQAWIVFTGLARTPDVPPLDLRVSVSGSECRVDVTEHCDKLLKLSLERIGPRNSLGLLRIDGWLNSINVGTLVESIEGLSNTGISRIVVGFGEHARELDEPLGSWLQQTAEGVQTSQTYAMFPAVVSTIRELHVAAIPGHRRDVSALHVHGSLGSAVESALASAYRGLGPAEIAAEIEQGHPLARAAALVNGGADLPDEYLPLLLKQTQSEDTLLQRGAFIALSGSGDPAAIRHLTEQAGGKDREAAELALECLAASRFTGAHEALRQLLDRTLAVDRAAVVRILARYPRPHWAEYMENLAMDRSGGVPADVRRDVVLALGRTGHPDLTEILGHVLKSPDGQLQQAAFGLLLNRPDEASEKLALEHALGQLAQGPPTPAMLQLFDQVRDPRIAPLLVKHLDNAKQNRTPLINTLARIGPEDIDDVLADRYDGFNPSEQAAVLSNLTHLRSPRLLPLARAGLFSAQHPVFNASVHALGLQTDAAAVDALSDRLAEEVEIGRISTIAKALEEIGLAEAGRALDAARKSSSGDKRRAIARYLRSLQMRSPGGQYLQIAERHATENEHQKAVDYYSLAIKRDPDMAPAYSGRGHAHLKLEDYKRAEEDFRRGIELDEDDGLAVAGLGITLAIAGSTEEAIRIVEDASPRFAEDLLFAYNAACVYGRVIERLAAEPDSGDHQQRIAQLQVAALSRLRSSIDLGFPDLGWMREDPDLASLRHIEEFQKLATPAEDDGQPHDPEDGNARPTPDRQPQPPPPPVPGEQ
jgi:tetratricopeptide (TPR) repeat protein